MQGTHRISHLARILSRDLKLICLSNFMGAFGDGLFTYLLPIFIRGKGASPADVGLLFSLLALSTALTIIPGGVLADKFDLKKIIIFGWLVWIPLPLMFLGATHWSQLVLPMILYGLFFNGPANNAYVANSSQAGNLTLTFALVSAAWSSGYVVSPALGGYLATTVGIDWVFVLALIFFTVATVLIFPVKSQHAARRVNSSEDSGSSSAKKLVFLSLFFAVAMFSQMLIRPLIAQFLAEVHCFDSFYIGIFGSITSLGWTLFALVLGAIGDRRTKSLAVTLSLIIGSLSLWLLTSFNSYYLIAVSAFLYGATYPLWYLMNASVSSLAPETHRGRWLSILQVTVMLSAFIAPYPGGELYSMSPLMPFNIVILISPLLALTLLAKPFKELSHTLSKDKTATAKAETPDSTSPF